MPILLALSITPPAPDETATDSPLPKRGPSLQFVTDTIDLGPTSDEEEVDWEFRFKNTGDEDLIFLCPVPSSYPHGGSCGPIESDFDVRIGPRIEVEYDVVDLGPISDLESLEWVFFFTNVGDEDLEVGCPSTWTASGPGPCAAGIEEVERTIGPRITFASDTIDLDVISDEREVPWEFRFTNTGDELLEIEVDWGPEPETVWK